MDEKENISRISNPVPSKAIRNDDIVMICDAGGSNANEDLEIT
jgi:hypothetical protein